MDRDTGFNPIKTTLLSTSAWLSLSKSTRTELAKLFNIPKTGTPSASIGSAGSKIDSDGYTPQDLAAITVAKMQQVLDSDSTDFYGLFGQIVAVIENPEVVAGTEQIDANVIKLGSVIVLPKRRGRPRKNEK